MQEKRQVIYIYVGNNGTIIYIHIHLGFGFRGIYRDNGKESGSYYLGILCVVPNCLGPFGLNSHGILAACAFRDTFLLLSRAYPAPNSFGIEVLTYCKVSWLLF